jgi:hypothetical protein
MTDDTYTAARGPSRVNMHDPIECAWHCRNWNCTKD